MALNRAALAAVLTDKTPAISCRFVESDILSNMLNKIEEAGTSKSTFFEVLGGVEKVRELVERFYDIMDSDPKAVGIRALHPADLTSSREKLFMFLTGWSGGPQLYIERYGHPMLRRRHLPFTIGAAERDQWMYCMVRAMHDIGIEQPVMLKLTEALWDVADFMRNRLPT